MRSLSLAQSLRHAGRSLGRSPSFTLVALTTMAIGIGATTAAFTALDAALVRPLPYPTQARLAIVSETRRGSEISVSYPDFDDWRQRAKSFEALASYRGQTITLTGSASPERVRGQIVSANLLTVLGVAPLVGRPFDASSDTPGAPAEALLGYGLWQRRFGGDPDVVGRTIDVDDRPVEVAGVMPRTFDFPSGIVYNPAELYLSFGAYWEDDFSNRDSHPGVEAIGLLRPGATLDRARSELADISAALATEHPDSNRDTAALVRDAITVIVGDLSGQLKTVTIASLAVLAIACANLAGLILTRTIARERELAVRTALGAGRARVATTLLAEPLLLGLAGAAAGIGLAYLLLGALQPLVADLPRLSGLRPDPTALALAMAAALATVALASLAPMAWTGRLMRESWLRRRGETRAGGRFRNALVAAQVGLALALLVSATLLTRSLDRLQADPGGIVADGSLTFALGLPDATYDDAGGFRFYRGLYERLAAGPGVTAVGGISTLPFSGSGAQSAIRPVGSDDSAKVRTDVAVVSIDYFRAMGVRALRGRVFDEHDAADTPTVVVVDEWLAARLWPDRNPIGQHVTGWGIDDAEVVGVVDHVTNYGVGAVSREELYMPLAQRPRTRMTTIVRTDGNPLSLAAFTRQTVTDMDPSLAISSVRTMRAVVDATVAGPKLAALLSSGFGASAVALALIGLYGLVAYSVELRRREAGVRMALGATSAGVVRLMMTGTMGPVFTGVVLGCAGALGAGRVLESQLFGTSPRDPVVIASAVIGLLAVAMVASWIPARRAARVPPSIVLQEE